MVGPGRWIAGIGAAIVIVVLLNTFWSILSVSRTCPAPGTEPPKDVEAVLIYAAPKTFGVNDHLCIAWKPNAYFSAELKAKQALLDAKAEEAGVATKRAAAPAADTALDAILKLQQERRAAAQTRVDAIPATTIVHLFIDKTQTQVGFPARVPEPGEKDQWLWQGVALNAEEKHDTDTAKLWRSLLAGVNIQGNRNVAIGLGDDKGKLPREGFEWGKELKISAFQLGWLLLAAVGFLAVMVGVLMMGWRTPMLRVRNPTAVRLDGRAGPDNPPFSLGRVQMVWWFILTLAGFMFVWLTTGQWMGVMTSSVVGLLGISGVSGLAAVAIDGNDDTGPKRFDLKTIQSRNFLFDLLSDGENIVLHRVQMVAWTLVLGLIFAWTVVARYSFPEFDATLLTLSGIVSGLYLGFKFPENRGATSRQPDAPGPGAGTGAGAAGDDTVGGRAGDDTVGGVAGDDSIGGRA